MTFPTLRYLGDKSRPIRTEIAASLHFKSSSLATLYKKIAHKIGNFFTIWTCVLGWLLPGSAKTKSDISWSDFQFLLKKNLDNYNRQVKIDKGRFHGRVILHTLTRVNARV